MTENNNNIAGENTPATPGIPTPPKARSRKRPCAKQGGRKKENAARTKGRYSRDNGQGDGAGASGRDNTRQPAQRKLNQYVLDPYTGVVSSVRSVNDITPGSRVIEQPAGHPRPSLAAFYDATLLPAGSTIVARWGEAPAELDPQLVARLGRLAKIAGYGEQARKTMFDQIARCGNPRTALEDAITRIAGPDALSVVPGELTTTMGRDDLAGVIALSINAGNDDLIELADIMPMRLAPSERLVRHLADMPGMIEALDEEGNGSVLHVRGHRFDEKAAICTALREAGGRDIEVKNTQIEREGRKVRAFVVSARFAALPVEIAAARTGNVAALNHIINNDGSVHARYDVDMYGTTVSTNPIPCEPSMASVAALLREAAKIDESLARTIDAVEASVAGGAETVALRVGPVRTMDQLLERLATMDLTADTVLGDGYTQRLAEAADHIRLADGRKVNVTYEQGAARLGELSLHPTDHRALLLPESVDGIDEDTPTIMRQVRFETKKGSNRPRVIVEDIEVSEVQARRERFLEGRDPQAGLIAECRENFLADATRTMADALANPPKTRESVRNPEGLAKRVTFNRSIDPYLATGGDIVFLVQQLAEAQGEQLWTTWCRDQVKTYRDSASRLRRNGQTVPEDFFDVAGLSTMERRILMSAANALLAERLGSHVDDDTVIEMAGKVREAIAGKTFEAIDRGRALYQHLQRESV